MIHALAPLRRIAAFFGRHRSALLVAAALGFGALAVFGARGYLAERIEIEKARLASKQDTVEIVVARHDLPAGTVVDAESMAVREVPSDLVPGSTVRPERFEQHVGARIGQPMRSGEPLLVAAIVGSDASAFSSRIRPGIRAMSVLVDEVNSVSGMLQPGDRIDLLFTVRPPVSPGMPPAQEVTSALMQDMTVLATGRQVRADKGDSGGMRHFTAITVEVSPSQAQQLIVAQRSGKLTAMLRNPEDRQPWRPRAMDLNALLGVDGPQRAVAVPRAIGPEIIVGGRGALVATASVAQFPIDGFETSRSPGPPASQSPAGARPDAVAPQSRLPRGNARANAAAAAGDDARRDDGTWELHRFGREASHEASVGAPIAGAQ